AAGLKKEVVAGETLRQPLPNLIDVGAGRLATSVEAAAELDAQEGGMRPVIGRVDRGPARRQADIRQRQLQVLRRHDLVNELVDFAYLLLRGFHAGPTGRAQ